MVDEFDVKIANISIGKNNKINSGNIIKESFKSNNNPFFIKLLGNRYNEIIIFLSYYMSNTYKGYFQELEYTSCNDEKQYVFNAQKINLNFHFNYATFINNTDKNNIVIFKNGKK